MKINKKEIIEELKNLKTVANSKSNILPATFGILFSGNKMTAYSPELTLSAAINFTVEEDFILPYKAIDYIINLPIETFDITIKDRKITITSEIGKSTFTSYDVKEFPASPEIEVKSRFELDSEMFLSGVSRVTYACAVNFDDRPIYNGVFLNSDDEFLNIVACDGKRIAWNKIKFEGEVSAIIHKNIIQKLISMDPKGKISFLQSSNKIEIIVDKYIFNCPLLNGMFMDYKSMIQSAGYDASFIVNKSELSSCINRSLLLSQSGVNLYETDENDKEMLNVSCKSADASFAESVEILDNKADFKFKINSKSLLEAIKNFPSDDIEIFFKNSNSGIILKEENTELVAFILPVIIKEGE